MTELNATAARLADAAEKLLSEVRRVQSDTGRMVGRMDPRYFTGDTTPSWLPPRPMKSFKDAFEVIEQARRELLTCEYHLAAIRGRIDEIASDAISRREFKTWLKDETPRE